MSANLTEDGQWLDEATGELVVNGFVYYGNQNLDPVLNPLAGGIFSDRALTIALPNPIRTGADGRTVDKVWLSGRYSLKLEDSNNVQLYQELDVGENETTGTTSLTNVQGTNTITADGIPTVDELVNGQFYVFIPVITNTGAVTLQIDSTTAKAVEVNGGALAGDELLADVTVAVAFNSVADVFDMVVQVNKDALGLGVTDDVTFNSITAGAVAGGMVATQAQLETGTSLTTVVSPGRQQFHQSAAKAWVKYSSITTTDVVASFNMTSLTRNGTGDNTVNIATDFSNQHFGMAGICGGAVATVKVMGIIVDVPTAGTVRMGTVTASTGALLDLSDNSLILFGDQ